jgi:WD40 repeat protein
VAAYDFSSSGLDSTASAQGFGTLQQAPLSSDAMLTSASSFTYERGVNIVQSNGYVSSMYDATMSTSGGSATGADTSAAFQMHNMPLHMASGYGGGGAIHAASTVQQLQASSPTAVTPNLMTAAEQIRVDCVQLTTNGRYVVTGSIYGPPQVWDMKNGELVKMMSGEELSSTDLHLANGDTLLIGQVAEVETVDAADIDSAANRPPHRKLQIWDFDSGRPLEMRKNESCTASCMMSDGERMVLARNEHYGGTGTTVIIWDVLGNEPVRRLGCNSPVSAGDNVTYVGVSRDSRYVVAGYQGTADGQAYFIIFDLSEHDVTAPKLLTLPAAVEVTAILENHEAVTGTLAGELVVWSLRTGKPLRHLVSTSTASAMAHGGSAKAHRREVKDLAVSKDVALLVSASADSTLGIWSLETDKLMTVLNGHRDEVWCCALSNDNELVVSGSRDHTIRLWRVTDGVAVAAIDAGVDIFRVLISNNKRTVVALADKFSTRKLIMLQIVRSKTKSSSSSRSTLH